MKRMRNLVSTLVGLLALIVLAAALSWLLKAQRALPGPQALTSQPVAGVSQQDSPLPTPTWAPTPLPPALPPPPDFTPAPTPIEPLTPLPIAPALPENRLTPVPLSKTVDLAVGLPEEKRLVYIILRTNTTFEKYIVPADSSYESIMQLLNLGPWDTIVLMYTEKAPTPAPCVAIAEDKTPTPTPRFGEYGPLVDICTPTPLPIAKTVDLATGLPDENKMVYIIQRADGTYEKYLIPSIADREPKELMNMGPQDVIVALYPLKPQPGRIALSPEDLTRIAEPTPTPLSLPQETPTPPLIARTVDLAVGVSDETKIVCIIHRADGTYEEYVIPSAPNLETVTRLLNLGPQDTIVTAFPLKPLASSSLIGVTPSAEFSTSPQAQ